MSVVSRTTSRITAHEIRPREAASRSAPAAPTPDASVGVAIPKKVLPRTAKMSSEVGTTFRSTATTSSKSTTSGRSEAGATAGRSAGRTSR